MFRPKQSMILSLIGSISMMHPVGKYALYTPANASEDNKRPLLIWFHGTGERYHGANPGGNLIGNRVLAFADEEFREALNGCYVLAPQSTTAGWSGNRLNDMEALINTVIAENNVDITRVFVGGLSMGTAMTTPLITSTTDNKIPFAAAILCAGGNISESQAEIIAEKGFPVYLVGSSSDWATMGFSTALSNMLAAGIDAKMALYPAGPVFDGDHYYGAHDAWNYIYNNLVEDENGQTIFEWLANRKIPMPLEVTTTANLVKQGDTLMYWLPSVILWQPMLSVSFSTMTAVSLSSVATSVISMVYPALQVKKEMDKSN